MPLSLLMWNGDHSKMKYRIVVKVEGVHISKAVRKTLGAQPGSEKHVSHSSWICQRPTLASEPQVASSKQVFSCYSYNLLIVINVQTWCIYKIIGNSLLSQINLLSHISLLIYVLLLLLLKTLHPELIYEDCLQTHTSLPLLRCRIMELKPGYQTKKAYP